MIAFGIAKRYLFATKGRLFARALTMVAIGSVALGVYAMLVVLGVMLGFRDHLEAKLLGFMPHVTIRIAADASSDAIATELERLVAHFAGRFVPVVEGEVVAHPAERDGFSDLGVRVRGLAARDLDVMRGATFYFASDLKSHGEAAGIAALARDEATHTPGLVVGNEVLYALGVYPETDRAVLLTAPLGLIDPSGNLRPIQRAYEVRGFFRSGLYQQDSKLVFMEYAEAQALLGTQANPMWFVYFADPGVTADFVRRATAEFGAQIVMQTWMEQNQKLLSALKLERVVMSLLLAITVAIACLSILGVVFMHVMSRRRDLAILAAMGASPRVIRRTVVALGAWIGVIGSVVGLSGAMLTWWWSQHYPVRLPETFYLDYLPFEFRPLGTVMIVLVGIGFAMIAAWYPARLAAQFSAAEGLRSE